VNALHAAAGPILLVALLAFGVIAVGCAMTRRLPRSLDRARQVLLGLVVAQAAIGLALAVRGGAPAEWIHWLYGALVVVALLAPGVLADDVPVARRAAVLAGGAGLAVVMAWRLGASG
jgi:heme A synthase